MRRVLIAFLLLNLLLSLALLVITLGVVVRLPPRYVLVPRRLRCYEAFSFCYLRFVIISFVLGAVRLPALV